MEARLSHGEYLFHSIKSFTETFWPPSFRTRYTIWRSRCLSSHSCRSAFLKKEAFFRPPPFQRHSIVHFIRVTDVPPFKVLSPQNIRISVYSVARPKRKETFFWMRAFSKEESWHFAGVISESAVKDDCCSEDSALFRVQKARDVL